MKLPLHGMVVLEFAQYLSGPSAGLRLADLGARVIKIERPVSGDACRQLAIKNLWVDESSLVFNTINRNKESFSADFKDSDDVTVIKQLIAKAAILIHNFRPGVMEKIGLDYGSVKKINPKIIYTEITGYGKTGPWRNKPGQDLLIQSVSGLTYLTGNAHHDPLPFGLAITDYLCGNHAVQGILAALIRQKKSGVGAYLELSMLESIIDFQFEFFTTYFKTGSQPQRSSINNGHSLLSAPYGIYHTKDGYIGVAMMPLSKLVSVTGCNEAAGFLDTEAFSKRDIIKEILSRHFLNNTTECWLQIMNAHHLWVMPVLDWHSLMATESYKANQIEQALTIKFKDHSIITTRCPIRINHQILFSPVAAPKLGEHVQKIKMELLKDTSCNY